MPDIATFNVNSTTWPGIRNILDWSKFTKIKYTKFYPTGETGHADEVEDEIWFVSVEDGQAWADDLLTDAGVYSFRLGLIPSGQTVTEDEEIWVLFNKLG